MQENKVQLNDSDKQLQAEFPGLPSCHRCLELLPRCAVPLSALFDHLKGRCTGITILDSSPLAVCDNLRIPGIASLPRSPPAARARLAGSTV